MAGPENRQSVRLHLLNISLDQNRIVIRAGAVAGPAIRTIIGLAEFSVMDVSCEIYTKSGCEG